VAGARNREAAGHTLLDEGRRLGCVEAWVATEVSNEAARRLYRSAWGREDSEHAVV
jgi:ribosomal protein S18 acetylase RimI-like enzyme